jgi:hypothetical protein
MGTGALTVGGVAVYYWLRARQVARSGRWRPGPNALWGRDRPQIGPQSGSTETGYLLPLLQQLMGMQQMQQMQQTMMLAWMQRGGPPSPHAPGGWWEDPLDSDENPTADLSIWNWEDLWR